ncbi:MAG: sodium:solute symporter family protein, partial [Planctomycetota bacterium]|nr:sodium:solute symporter family protein [Planctomycetota bacterium]
AQKGFTGGFAAFHIAVCAGIVCLVVGWSGFIVVPLRRMGVMTIPEFYERRFGRGVRILGGLLLALSGILNMGMFLKAGSIFVVEVTGLEGTTIKWVMTALLGLVLFYTILGGMVSIVLTDYVQFVVLSFGLIVTTLFAIQELGWQNIVNGVEKLKGAGGFDPIASEAFGLDYVVWMIFLGLVSCAIWQTAVMRACSARSVEDVKRIYAWSSIGFLIRFLVPNFLGLCALVYFAGHAELFPEGLEGEGGSGLQAMPRFLGILLPSGLLGLVAAGMLAAFMSTHDSYLLCWSSVLTQDVIAPLGGDRMSTRSRLNLTRLLIFAIGIFLLIWSLWYELRQDLWDYMAITGAIYFTGAFALLVAGLYWKNASRVGAYLALVVGLSAVLGLKPIQEAAQKVLSVQLDWDGEIIGISTVAASSLAMVLGSLAFPDRQGPGQDDLTAKREVTT